MADIRNYSQYGNGNPTTIRTKYVITGNAQQAIEMELKNELYVLVKKDSVDGNTYDLKRINKDNDKISGDNITIIATYDPKRGIQEADGNECPEAIKQYLNENNIANNHLNYKKHE